MGGETEDLIKAQFDRLLHLYLAPRAERKRVHMNPEDLLDKITNLEDMKPFPSKVGISTRVIGPVNGIDVSSEDGTIAVASNDDRVGLMDPRTGRIFSEVRIKTDAASEEFILDIKFLQPGLLGVTTSRRLLLLAFRQNRAAFGEISKLVGDLKAAAENAEAREQKLVQDEDEQVVFDSELKQTPEGQGLKAKFAKSYARPNFAFPNFSPSRRGLQVVLEAQFREFVKHAFIDAKRLFVAAVLQNKDGNRRISVLNLKSCTQTSLKIRTKNKIEKVLFHPKKPQLFIITRIHVFIFNLRGQSVSKTLLSGCRHITSGVIHPSGDHLLLGTADRKTVWFDLDSGDKPYKKMKVHDKAMSAVAFHKNFKHFPLMASAGHDSKAVVQFAKTDPENLEDPMIVPLKSLRGHSTFDGFGVNSIAFCGLKHWLVTAGQDRFVKIWV